jgi:hypothetical protein
LDCDGETTAKPTELKSVHIDANGLFDIRDFDVKRKLYDVLTSIVGSDVVIVIAEPVE